jgi:tRNA A-37 threonylcarbamoyl transferase component Bud32/tetratricopeptide (TPR) repeat protein
MSQDPTDASEAAITRAESGRARTHETATAPSSRGADWAEALPPGTMLGRYVLVSRLGAGGAGLVYAAFDPELGRRVAIKLLRDQTAIGESSSTAGRARLLREAQAMARVTHPNVMPIYDVGVFRERVFLAMELVEGGTLRDWLRQPRTRREILDVLAAAGRGLAAAHAAELVHRDFKPDNVLIGKDGSVRVTDFGLVRSAAVLSDESVNASVNVSVNANANVDVDVDVNASANAFDAPLTEVNTVMGTPPYMAPEQHLAHATDARTDQFSYCVTLHEALYGIRPFPGRTPEELEEQACNGRVVDPPAQRRVPTWLRQLILRGLSPSPAARFPSMNALLDALADDPAIRRRRWLAALAMLAAVVGMVTGGWAWVRHQTRRCRGVQSRLVGAWDAAVRSQVALGLAKAGVPSPEVLVRAVSATLDAYAREWTDMHVDACEAARVRGEQTEAVLDLRMACLDDRLHELRALTTLFSSADAGVARKSVEAAAALSPVRTCGDVAALSAPLPPPRDRASASHVEALREKMAQTRALLHAGRYQDGLRAATPIVDEATPLRYPPLEAEAKLLRGQLLAEAGRHAEAETALADAYVTAYAGRHDAVAAEAAIWEIWVESYWLVHMAEGHRWARFAEAAIRRLGENEGLEAQRLWRDAQVYMQEGNPTAALANARRALVLGEKAFGPRSPMAGFLHRAVGSAYAAAEDWAHEEAEDRIALGILEETLGPDHNEVGGTLQNLALSIGGQQGRLAESATLHQRALAVLESSLGPDHPRIAIELQNLGDLLRRQGKWADALAAYRRALAINDQHFSPDYPESTWVLHGIGRAHLGLDKPGEAIPWFERSLALARKAHLPELTIGNLEMGMAWALWEAKPDAGARARAHALAVHARATALETRSSALREEADDFLTSHKLR